MPFRETPTPHILQQGSSESSVFTSQGRPSGHRKSTKMNPETEPGKHDWKWTSELFGRVSAGPRCGAVGNVAQGTLGPNIFIDPHRACRQAHGRVRRILVMLVVVVQIILQLIQWRGTLLTSLRHSGPNRAPDF